MTCQTLLVDGPYLAHRSYAAPFKLTTSHGLDATIIPTFLRSLLACHKQFQPKETIIAWESHGTPSWRRAANPNYKPKQALDFNFINQVKDLQNLLYLLGIEQYYSPTNEADDVIATLCKPDTLIYSVDKDLMQLLKQGVYQWTGKDMFDEFRVVEKFGVPPKLIPDLLALMGDASDNIIGIRGWGQKKSSKLIARYGQVEDWFSGKDNPSLTDNEYMQVIKNKQLTTLNRNCELVKLKFTLVDLTIDAILNKYELKKLRESIDDYKVFKRESIDEYF